MKNPAAHDPIFERDWRKSRLCIMDNANLTAALALAVELAGDPVKDFAAHAKAKAYLGREGELDLHDTIDVLRVSAASSMRGLRRLIGVCQTESLVQAVEIKNEFQHLYASDFSEDRSEPVFAVREATRAEARRMSMKGPFYFLTAR
jgi:hypothetical protein